ncbi:hypothetical protein [Microseira wollei]|nr:hypothetical protein [Microseira wollei]
MPCYAVPRQCCVTQNLLPSFRGAIAFSNQSPATDEAIALKAIKH